MAYSVYYLDIYDILGYSWIEWDTGPSIWYISIYGTFEEDNISA
jgi:hypothetical protein